MRFVYERRNSDGKLVKDEVAAPSRSEAYKSLNAQHIRPIRLKECPQAHDQGESSIEWRYVLAWSMLGILILMVICGWFFLDEIPTSQKEPKEIIHKGESVESLLTNHLQRTSASDKIQKLPQELQPPSRSSTSGQNRRRKLVEVKLTEDEQREIDRLNRDTTLRTVAENRMALLASIPPGMPVPPMPDPPGLAKSLEVAEKNVISALPDDTEQELKVKEFVIQLKERIRQAKTEGKTAVEALKEYEGEMNRVAKYRREIYAAARQMQREGNDAEARKMVAEVNEELAEAGALPIELDTKPRKRLKDQDNSKEK